MCAMCVCTNKVYVRCRLQDLAGGVVMDVRLHEQPTGLNPVQRTSIYTKKLTWCSKGKLLPLPASSASVAFSRLRLGSSKKNG